MFLNWNLTVTNEYDTQYADYMHSHVEFQETAHAMMNWASSKLTLSAIRVNFRKMNTNTLLILEGIVILFMWHHT